MSRLDLVVFDLGGVLVRIVGSWEEAHEAAGLGPRPAAIADGFRDEVRRLSMALQVGMIEPSAYFEEVARASDGGYTADEIRSVLEAWMYDEYDGVDAVVDALDEAGVATAALSNTNAYHWDMLRLDGDASRFPTVRRLPKAFASHLVGAAKPDAAIYEALELETSASGQTVLFFDDVEAHVVAARDRGWQAERIDPMGDTAAQLMEHLTRYRVISD